MLQYDMCVNKGRSGYHLKAEIVFSTNIKGYDYVGKFYRIRPNGKVIIRRLYWWDGATCAIDTPAFMRASLIHDCLYQAMRDGVIKQSERINADKLLYKTCREDGMWFVKAKLVYYAVRLFGAKFARIKDNVR